MPDKKIIVAGIVTLTVVALLIYINHLRQPPLYKRQLALVDPPKSVQDSMKVLRQLCESVDSVRFMNCFVTPRDSIMIFNGKHLGVLKSVSEENEAFSSLRKEDAKRMLSVMKFLSRNLISGVVHDTSIGFWLYLYGEDSDHRDKTFIRDLYIWDTSKDTLSPAFNYYFKIIDRKEKMVLVRHNHF